MTEEKSNQPEQVKISEIVADMRPVWVDFVVQLGYTEEEGEAFADGYVEKLKELPITRKMYALSHQDDDCMAAGFENAGIDEQEAHDRYTGA